MKLSIGQAWDEAKAVFGADGRAIFAVALALVVLPGAIINTAAPSVTRTVETPMWVGLLGLVSALLSLTGQVAISRIALGPSTTVGEALALAFRRMPALFGALLLALLPFAILVTVFTSPLGASPDPAAVPPTVALLLLLIVLAGCCVLIRLLFMTPLAASRTLGPVGLIKEAWSLSRGRFLKLFGLSLIAMLVGFLLVGGLGGALASVVLMVFGKIAPGNVSALLVALIQAVTTATVTVLFVVVTCRLYTQAVGGTNASVPHAGHE